jgi:hypothetical protein
MKTGSKDSHFLWVLYLAVLFSLVATYDLEYETQ